MSTKASAVVDTTPRLPPHPSIAQVAEHYGVHPRTVRRLISRGDLTARRIGPKVLRLDRREVENLGCRVGGAR